MRYLTALLVAALLACQAVSAATQEDPPVEGRGARPGAGDALGPMAVIQMLDAYALVQAQDVLRLTDSQYAPFVTRLKRLQETRRRHQIARNQIIRELRRLTAPPGARANQAAPDDATANAERLKANEPAIRDRLRTLRETDERAAVELRQAYDALDEVLDVRQQGRFRVFEEMLETRKLDLLMRARQGAARGKGR